MADLDAAVMYAQATGEYDTARLGVTGFYWGKCITWPYHAARDSFSPQIRPHGMVGDNSKPEHCIQRSDLCREYDAARSILHYWKTTG